MGVQCNLARYTTCTLLMLETKLKRQLDEVYNMKRFYGIKNLGSEGFHMETKIQNSSTPYLLLGVKEIELKPFKIITTCGYMIKNQDTVGQRIYWEENLQSL